VGSATETVSLSYTADQNYNVTVGGTITAGDVVSASVQNAALPGGQETASYTVMSGDTLTSVATGLKSAINSDTNLQALGIGATSSSAVVSILSDTYFTTSTSGGATETMTLGTNNRGNVSITLGGSATTGDTLTVSAHNQTLSGGLQAVTYTVLSSDNLLSISNGIAAAINANSNLQTLGVTVPTNSAALAFSQRFSGNAQLPTAASTASATVTDGGSNVKTNGINLSVATGTSSSPTYDLNGNMTSDGNGNSYSWDAENRLLQITYPGSGNNSQFAYDGLGRNVQILEYTAASLTSTKQFVWDDDRCEARNSSSTITAQYYLFGETISGTSYFYDLDHLGSVREMTASSGSIKAQYAFDPFGQVTKISETVASDLSYAEYYFHSGSELNLALYRAFSGKLGRWISRDPLAEMVPQIGFYSYVSNDPVQYVDSLGLSGPWHPPAGVRAGCTNSDSCSQLAGKICLLNKMLKSHTGWDQHVPPPNGGGRHAQEIADLWRALANCQALYASKCGAQGTPGNTQTSTTPTTTTPTTPTTTPFQTPPWQDNVPWWMLGLRYVGPVLLGLETCSDGHKWPIRSGQYF
jgi:RHS repeat-associated protein